MATTKNAKATAKKVAAKKTTARKTPAGASGRRKMFVRMYDVGFGDAFLVRISRRNGELRILFDCGSIQASAAGGAMGNVVRKIIADVTDADGVARIDVIVATHRHKDHVSGFADDAWNAVEVKEVWMPWTEHPTDPQARRIRNLQSNLALALSAGLAAAPAAVDAAAQRAHSVAADLVANALMLSNDGAMKMLHSGFSGLPERRFLPSKADDGRALVTAALPGVRIHVLGPSRDPELIRDMDPPKGESFLRVRGAGLGGHGAAPAPFVPEFMLTQSVGAWTFSPDDQAAIEGAGGLSELAVAVALDKAVNGTSLMLILEVAGTLLLFPGDAQWGTWMAALEDPHWRELLQRVSFYKIGHHGSHNATPQTFVRDLLPRGCCAMASTLTRKIWPNIPRQELLTGLIAKAADVARSDQPSAATARAFKVAPGVIEATVLL
ncbi:MAG: hypothetical protein LCI02_03765 [Proteobacteria bacterium]|nr:hypothetical protein [Pseudomonadota bacterium]